MSRLAFIASLPLDEQVSVALADLAIARGGVADDAAQRVYNDLLADLDPAIVVRACHELGKQPRGEFATSLPSVGDIRDAALSLQRHDEVSAAAARVLPMPKVEDDEPRYFCGLCRDEPNGWRVYRCEGDGGCGRSTHQTTWQSRPKGAPVMIARCTHPHEYVERCVCWERNPVVARAKTAHG